MIGVMTAIINDQRRYPHGVPCWVDTEQPDLTAAARFYTALFGWTFTDAIPAEAPGSYLIATLDGHDVAAIGPGGANPAWNTYIACDDVDATGVIEEGVIEIDQDSIHGTILVTGTWLAP